MVSEVPLKGIHLTLKMTSPPVTNNGSFQNYYHLGDHTTRTNDCLCLLRLSNVDLSGHLRGQCYGSPCRCAYLCPQSSFIHFSCEIIPIHDGAFQNMVCPACIFFITFKPWLYGFLQGCLASSVLDEVAAHKMYQSLRKKCPLSFL